MMMAVMVLLLVAVPAYAQNQFPTGKTVGGAFKLFWEKNGGLPVFGYPITDESSEPSMDTGKLYTTQYFERQRFEYHPEHAGTPYEVQLGLLGSQMLEFQGRNWQDFPKADPKSAHYFAQTGHAIDHNFWNYWSSNGLNLGDRGVSMRESVALFGYPISPAMMETNASGNNVLTQWFERARFEYYPNNAAMYKVQLGLLGNETMSSGTQTSQPAMLSMVSGGWAKPIISTGDVLPNGFMFQSIPDGIGIVGRGRGVAEVFVAHEMSTVPFPAVGQPNAAADMKNAEVSHLLISQSSARVLTGKTIWSSDLGYIRFCSAFLATEKEGFKTPVFFTGEESSDMISLPPNAVYPAVEPKRQAGYVIAVDATGKQYTIAGMGRANHENTVIVPGGWKKIVALTDDDTFSAPSAQLYLYMADTPDDLLADKGALYGFVADDAKLNDYGDVTKGMSVSGKFIPIPRDVALGDQTALENWSNANNVFQFIRTEDIAYDKNNPRIVYIADTGEPRAIPDDATGRLKRGPSSTRGAYPNGKVWKMVMNASDPLKVDSLEVLIDADGGGYNNPAALHNPDNLDTSMGSLMIQEDPVSANPYTAKIWQYNLKTGELKFVAEAAQPLLDPTARTGEWETSGIVNASDVFGPNMWLVNVQAHTKWIATEQANGYTKKREGGQLLLVYIPDSE